MAWVQRYDIPMDRTPYNFALEFKGDWQIGSSSTCLWRIDDDIKETLERAKTMDSGVLFLGDIEDEDRPSTREMRKKIAAERAEVVGRDAEKHVAFLESDVIPRLMQLHTGTKYGIMGGVAGHHWTFLPGGMKVGDRTVYSSVEYMFARLEAATGKPCVYLGQMVSFVDLRFSLAKKKGGATHPNTCRSVGLIQHGEGGGGTKGATVSKLERAAQGFDAQWYARGHDCQIVGTKTDQLYARESRGGEGSIGGRTKTMLNLGAATMGYETGRGDPSYVEKGMMRPVTMGWGTKLFRIRNAHTQEDPNQNLRADIKLLF